jgi:hypothetical protein
MQTYNKKDSLQNDSLCMLGIVFEISILFFWRMINMDTHRVNHPDFYGGYGTSPDSNHNSHLHTHKYHPQHDHLGEEQYDQNNHYNLILVHKMGTP